MADMASSTDCARWTSALANYSVAELAWDAVAGEAPCDAREDIERTLKRARHALLATPAPSIAEVAHKLELHWGDALLGDDWSSSVNRTVIGDLRRIALLAAGVDATEAAGRTPEEMAELTEAWRAALADYHSHEQLLAEGLSARWAGRKAADIVDAADHAAGELLRLPAPSLRAVAHKLELLWEVERFDSIEEGGLFVQIVGDLNRLAHALDLVAGQPR